MSQRTKKGVDLFLQGYTCSQAVLLAFSDLTGLDERTAGQLSSVFGGGMGGLRSTCGAVTGMFMVTGLLYGFAVPCDNAEKALCYSRIRYLAEQFEAKYNTLICKELLADLPDKLTVTPSVRNKEYYKMRPCTLLVEDAIAIVEQYISEIGDKP